MRPISERPSAQIVNIKKPQKCTTFRYVGQNAKKNVKHVGVCVCAVVMNNVHVRSRDFIEIFGKGESHFVNSSEFCWKINCHTNAINQNGDSQQIENNLIFRRNLKIDQMTKCVDMNSNDVQNFSFENKKYKPDFLVMDFIVTKIHS